MSTGRGTELRRQQMCLKNKIITILLLSFFAFSIPVPNAHADAAPSEDFFIVSGIIAGTACLGLAVWFVISKLSKDGQEKKAPVTSVLFDQESVDLKINGNKMEVDATFEYQNSTTEKLRMELFFPFPRSIRISVRDISVLLLCPDRVNGRRSKFLQYETHKNQIFFDFIIYPKERVLLKVHYVETLEENKAEYILTTVKRWKRPVTQATFSVQIPSTIKNPAFSFKEGLVEKHYIEGSGSLLYKFSLPNLYPDREFQIAWQIE